MSYYLTEADARELAEEVAEEGIRDWMRTAAGAMTARRRGSPPEAPEAGGGPSPSPDPPPGPDPTPDPEPAVSKDLPLAITRYNKEGPRSASGAKEIPLNAYLQKKLGLSPQAATRLSKNIGAYLKSKGVPVMEHVRSLLEDAAILEATRYSSPSAQASYEGGVTAFNKKFKQAHARKKEIEAKLADPSLNPRQKRAAQTQMRGIEKDMSTLARERGDWKRAEKSRRKGVEATEHGRGIIGNIIMKYVARMAVGQGHSKDKTFPTDAKAQQKVIKQVHNMIRRQFKRRGYSEEEYTKILKENSLKDLLMEEFYFELLTANTPHVLQEQQSLDRWKILAGVK